ncbi:anti-virulence regulator CigR family protein [Pseudomonas sp. RTC3]|uniref:anti-virulence regulator CigR family protein n=1 Tax=unclassified Pseudomonas TaxID=196821 RepID=UPI002AB57D99|nr:MULTISPECIES: anti-virulence regulator CigR family protein [unclassified Pseudomonas]MEB0062052.1 anti-virulence regulator CigR family protein [Pseudomonas sp. RTC3]MDY7567281.1 anti-virulence regulator CigR family protein [Pseudomonas sp. 5C2]MEB0005386.1 anti-virulence regulator CigR family protein [Pseudomonas sp. RTB2]MEB0016576.1 anti-virulence regulator CigR family protein [Pseudomonas sp. RTB3]MEB0027033.1 anti-virulence regulator CigR family protein [Pseudomonas sp. MH9.2]
MKLPTRLIAGLGILMISASPLLHADERDQRGGQDGGRQGENHQGNGNQENRGHDERNDRRDDHGPRRPPENFDEARRSFHDHREFIGRGQPLPPGFRIERGRPLPYGYGERLDPRAIEQLPRYDGYEWRRVGPDIVLIALTTGVIYTILEGVLN